MTSPITLHRHGDVLVIVSDNPPVNALGAAVRQGLESAIKEGVADASIAAMVIRCDGRTFFAGADITEFGKPMQEPALPTLVDMIEPADKPVLAAIHGTALAGRCECALGSHYRIAVPAATIDFPAVKTRLAPGAGGPQRTPPLLPARLAPACPATTQGGGCWVALGCQYRIAVPSAKLGCPEVKRGLLPGAGGTQRAPRLAGVPVALERTAKGDPIPAKRALDAGLIDRLAGEDSLEADAIAFARACAGKPLPRASQKTATPDPAAVAAFTKANAHRFRGFEAPAAHIARARKATAVPAAGGNQ